jgi:regulator of sigma E protease
VWSVRRGETEYGIGTIPLGGYVRISGMNPREELPPDVQDRAYFRQKPWKRIVVILAGPVMNVLIGFLILWGVFVFNVHFVAANDVDQVAKGSPAATVLRPGDRLVAVDGVRGDPARLRRQIATHRCPGEQTAGCAGTPARLTVERAGRTVSLTARPEYDAEAKRPLLGFAFDFRADKDGPAEAVSRSTTAMWDITTATVTTIGKLFYDAKARDEVSGVVGSYEATRQAVSSSLVEALGILAVISLSLAIVNLFPFLPLDGGHVFWALAEKLRGRAIPFSIMERAGFVGFVLVALLFLLGLTNDIDRLRGEGFGIR